MVRSIVLRISAALAVALTAGAVLVATGSSATANDGGAVILGTFNTESQATEVSNENGGGTCVFSVPNDGLIGCGDRGLAGYGSSTGIGVYGFGGTGVYRETLDAATSGVYGTNAAAGDGVSGVAPSGTGVYGNGGLYGIYGESATATGAAVLGNNTGSGSGVWGLVNNASSGVVGQNVGAGVGVTATAPNGTGVLADSVNGTALDVRGRSTFTTAGTAVVASGAKKVTVTLAGVTATDFVLATVQGSGAFYVKNASAGSGKFTVTINKAPTSPATVTVAYFVISAS